MLRLDVTGPGEWHRERQASVLVLRAFALWVVSSQNEPEQADSRVRFLPEESQPASHAPYLSDRCLSDWLQHHSVNRPDQIALESGDQRVSYGELAKQVAQVAAGLRAMDLKRGDVVALQLPNGVSFVVCYLAVCSLGCVVQMLHMPYRKRELRYLLTDADAAAVICLSSFKDESPADTMLEIAQTDLPRLRVVAVGNAPEGAFRLDDLNQEQAGGFLTNPQPDWPFVLLYTSGTTADPKGVVHYYDRFLGNAAIAAKELEITASTKVLCVAAFSHLYGLFTLNMCLFKGATAVLLPGFTPPAFKQALIEFKPSAVFAAPAHFMACLTQRLLTANELSSVSLVCLSGSKVPEELARTVEDLLSSGAVIQLWGMTELQAGTYGRPADAAAVRLLTAGRPSPGTELRIVDSRGMLLPEGKEGTLQIRGASVFAEYLNKPEETARAFSDDGWFDTGDLAVLDAGGCLRLTGRVKELINRGGVKYNPVEIEDIISELAVVQSCAVASVEDPVLGEIACLYVVLTEHASLSLEEIQTCLEAAEVAKYKWPERLVRLSQMPLTPTNKIARARLSEVVPD